MSIFQFSSNYTVEFPTVHVQLFASFHILNPLHDIYIAHFYVIIQSNCGIYKFDTYFEWYGYGKLHV